MKESAERETGVILRKGDSTVGELAEVHPHHADADDLEMAPRRLAYHRLRVRAEVFDG